MHAVKQIAHLSALLCLIAAMSVGAADNHASPLGMNLTNNIDWASELGEQVQADPRMRDWVLEYMRLWKENGGHEFMVFASGGGFWGQIPWGVEPMDAPKYAGHYEFIAQNPIWWDEPQLRAQPLVPASHIVSSARTGAVYDIAGRLLRLSPHWRTEADGTVLGLRPSLTRRPAAGVYVAR